MEAREDKVIFFGRWRIVGMGMGIVWWTGDNWYIGG